MEHVFKKSELYNLVDEEVSRVAAAAYSEDGQSLYDAIVLHSNDTREVMRFMDDAINTMVKRFSKIITILPGVDPTFAFNVPDLDAANESTVAESLECFIVMSAAAAWFQRKAKDQVEEFANRSQNALENAVQVIYTRKTPTR